MYLSIVTGLLVSFAAQCAKGAEIRTDPLVAGPPLEVVHLFNHQWPTGIAVSSTGRKFACFPAGLDPKNTNNGLNGKIQVAELKNKNTEVPYPSKEINNPPGGSINDVHIPPVTRGLKDYFLGVQSVVIDAEDNLWVLDTGRVAALTNPISPLLNATHGGTKLIKIDLKTDKIVQKIIFPSTVALPQSYFNDVRIDTKRQYAYITDSSPEGFNGIVVINLKTEHSFRTLTLSSENPNKDPVYPLPSVVPFVYGEPLYEILMPATQALNPGYITFGSDGISLSPDGETFYFSKIAGRYLYSLPTASLRDETANPVSKIKNLGEKGISDGLETDSNGVVYAGNVEQDAISMLKPKAEGGRGLATLFVRDPRINWVDTMSIATDGYLYFTVNQLNYLQAIYPGKGVPLLDRRQKPFVCFRAKLPDGGTKISGV